MSKHKCIYCLKEKEESEFNREHVIPRMMGTYTNSFVLSNFQVCKECNSYFSKELEDKISLNSMESFLRMKYGRPMSDGRKLKKDRVSFIGAEGLFKGLEFTPIVDKANDEKISLYIPPQIGIMTNESPLAYQYYTLDALPEATPEVLSRLRNKSNGIITFDIPEAKATPCLMRKGYLGDHSSYSNPPLADLFKDDAFLAHIKISIDSIVRRLCAKTVFNYICYSLGKDYVLSGKFSALRDYIRNGTWSNDLWFRYSQGPVSSVDMPNETAHVVGYMFYPGNRHGELCGCLTWFGQITYIFKLCDTDDAVNNVIVDPPTRMAYFNNDDATITEDNSPFPFPKDS
ncbi:MAG: HNH endonuclease [Christensenellales bacterium]|jgi:hypothetical protein